MTSYKSDLGHYHRRHANEAEIRKREVGSAVKPSNPGGVQNSPRGNYDPPPVKAAADKSIKELLMILTL